MSELKKELSTAELFFGDYFFRYCGIISAATFVVSSTFLAFSFNDLPLQLPLFYSLPWGEQQLAQPITLVLLQCVISFITTLNIAAAYATIKLSNFFSHTLLIGASFTSILGSIALIQIIRLVT